LSPQNYNIATGLMIAVPITNQVKGSPWEVPIPRGAGVTGAILSNQIRTMDWLARNTEFRSKSTHELMCEVLGRIEAILGLDCD
jgi:mRNA interferase MazF